MTFGIHKYWKTFKIPVFGISMMHLVRSGFVILAFGKFGKIWLVLSHFLDTYLVKFVFGTSISLVFVAIQKVLFSLNW